MNLFKYDTKANGIRGVIHMVCMNVNIHSIYAI
jgi:hypothetical protein